MGKRSNWHGLTRFVHHFLVNIANLRVGIMDETSTEIMTTMMKSIKSIKMRKMNLILLQEPGWR